MKKKVLKSKINNFLPYLKKNVILSNAIVSLNTTLRGPWRHSMRVQADFIAKGVNMGVNHYDGN